MRHAKSRLSRFIGDLSRMLDESAPVRLKTAPTGGRKYLFIFRIHYSSAYHIPLMLSNSVKKPSFEEKTRFL